jgi:hypothetical protein
MAPTASAFLAMDFPRSLRLSLILSLSVSLGAEGSNASFHTADYLVKVKGKGMHGSWHLASACVCYVWPDTKGSERRRQDESLHECCSSWHPNGWNYTQRHCTILYCCHSALSHCVLDRVLLSLRDNLVHFVVFACAVCHICSFFHVYACKNRSVLFCTTRTKYNAFSVKNQSILAESYILCNEFLSCHRQHTRYIWHLVYAYVT